MAKNDTLARHEQYYPSHYYRSLIVAFAEDENIPRSQVSSMAVKDFFDNMPQERKERLLSRAKNIY